MESFFKISNTMKRFLLILAMALATTAVSAQTVASYRIEPGMSYKELKQLYKGQTYTMTAGDPYSRTWSALSSLAVPGLGQFVCRENGRGLAFLGGSIALSVVGNFAANDMIDQFERDANGKLVLDNNNELICKNKNAAIRDLGILIGAGVAELVLGICSAVDASKIAKVKNMYYQDLQSRHAVNATLRPSVNIVQTATGTQPAAGMSFALQF